MRIYLICQFRDQPMRAIFANNGRAERGISQYLLCLEVGRHEGGVRGLAQHKVERKLVD